MSKLIRVLLVDDQQLMRAGLKTLLELEQDIVVIAEASNGLEAIKQFEVYKPDVVLMDIRMPELNGVEATKSIKQKDAQARVLILTTFDDDVFVYEGLRAGALGYMLKDVSGEELSNAVRTVAAGNALMSAGIAEKVLGQFSKLSPQDASGQHGLLEPLSEREEEILKLIAEGLSNAGIAKKLRLAEGTVKNYISIILQKTGAKDRTQVAVWAQSLGLL